MNKKVLAALGLTSYVSAYKCSWTRKLWADSTCKKPAGLLPQNRQPANAVTPDANGNVANDDWATWTENVANTFTMATTDAVTIGTC